MSVNGRITPRIPSAAAPAPRAKKMTLERVSRGVVKAPYRVFVYGVDGVGKTTFGADAPKPIFVGAEDGNDLLDVARFPAPETFADVLEAIDTLTKDPHEYETVVLDSADWIEPLIFAEVVADAGADVTTIEEVGGGYGKGYVAALDRWRVLLAALERLQAARRMNVIIIGHSTIKAFRNPEGDDYERYVLKMNDKAAGLLREWVKGVYFANYETHTVKQQSKRVKGISTGARWLYTQRTAAYDAKDRYGLPYRVPLSWVDFDKAATRGAPANPAALVEEIQRKAAELGGEVEAATAGWLAKNGTNALALSRMNERLNAKLAEKREAEGAAEPTVDTTDGAAPDATTQH